MKMLHSDSMVINSDEVPIFVDCWQGRAGAGRVLLIVHGLGERVVPGTRRGVRAAAKAHHERSQAKCRAHCAATWSNDRARSGVNSYGGLPHSG